MTFTVQIYTSPFNHVQSFTAVACGTEKITLREASANSSTVKEVKNVTSNGNQAR